MKKRILAVVAAIGILAGCYGPATGEVSPSGAVYTARWSKQYQYDTGYRYVFITYQCHDGPNYWLNGPVKDVLNTDTLSDFDTIQSQVYCPAGIRSAFPNDSLTP